MNIAQAIQSPMGLLIMAMQKFLPNSTMEIVESGSSETKAFRVYPNKEVLPYCWLPLEIPASFGLMTNAQVLDLLEPKVRWLKSEFMTLEIVNPPDPILEAEKTEEEKEEERIEQSRVSLLGAAPWVKI